MASLFLPWRWPLVREGLCRSRHVSTGGLRHTPRSIDSLRITSVLLLSASFGKPRTRLTEHPYLILQFATSKTQILLSVSEECLYTPSHRVQLNEMARWCVDLIRRGVPHTRFVVFVARVLLGDRSFTFLRRSARVSVPSCGTYRH